MTDINPNHKTYPSQRGAAYVKAGTASGLVVSGLEQPGTPDLQGREGWEFIKEETFPTTPDKINFYFFGGTVDILPHSHLSTIWTIITIDFYDGTSNGLPWIQLLTKMKGDGNDAGAYYRTQVNYHIPIGREHVRGAERVCLWAGNIEPPAELLNGARLLHLSPTRTGPAILPSDEILYLSLHTDTTHTRASFCVETLAYETNRNKTNAQMFNMHLKGV